MDYTVIILSALDLWSMEGGKGAPSFYNTVSLYSQKGNKAILIKPTGKRHHEYAVDGLEQVTFRNDFWEELCRIPKVSFFARILSARRMRREMIRCAEKVISEHQNEKILLYAYEVHAVDAAAWLQKKYGFPMVTRFQGTVLGVSIDLEKATWLDRWKLYPHFQALEQKSDMVIMTDDGSFGDRVLKCLGNQTKEVYFWRNGVKLSARLSAEEQTVRRTAMRDKLGIPEAAPVLMTLSRLAGWKRVDRSIDGLPLILKEYPETRLVVVGDGDARPALEEQAQKLGVADRVIFVGAVPQEQTGDYYAMADVFLSLYDLSNNGNPLFEALLNGKAVVTLDNGDTASVIKDRYNGILLPEYTPERLANAVLTLLRDNELRQTLSRNAQTYMAENWWSWEERMDTEYEKVSAMVEAYYNSPEHSQLFK